MISQLWAPSAFFDYGKNRENCKTIIEITLKKIKQKNVGDAFVFAIIAKTHV